MAAGTALFFYGTLLDEDVRDVVLRGHAPARLTEATLRGWRRVSVSGESFPILVRAPGGVVAGLVAHDVSTRALAILDDWERGYRRAVVSVVSTDDAALEAETYLPLPGQFAIAAIDWDLARWRREEKPAYLARNRAWRSRR